MKHSSESFIEKSKKCHEDEYNYSLVKYVNNKTPVTILCKIHGIFNQIPSNHTNRKAGCPKCANFKNAEKQRKNQYTFILQAQQTHEERYDYSKVEYVNNRTLVIIGCKHHHDFLKTPYHHVNKKQGCPRCVDLKLSEKYRKLKNDFILEAQKIHNKIYDYSKVEYKNSHTKIIIGCYLHGDFEQSPTNHIDSKNGCPKCGCNSISKKETEWLDSMNIKNRQEIFKIGNIFIKVDGYDEKTNTIYEFHGDFWHGGDKFDENYVNPKNKKTMKELREKTNIRDELIKKQGFSLVVMWGSEWK